MISAEIDTRGADRAFSAIGRKVDAARVFFGVIKSDAIKDLRTHQRERRGPGTVWLPRAAATIARRPKKGPRRSLLGRLLVARRVFVDDVGLRISSRVRWAGIHETGGTAGRGAQIPARSMWYFSPAFVEHAQAAFLRHVMREWDGN